MAFVLPTFNLTGKIVSFAGNPATAPVRLEVECQLRAPNVSYASSWFTVSNYTPGVISLWPPLTDIRDRWSAPINSPDYVEIPSGSGRWYFVAYVDDIGKGFPNEHRFALMGKVNNPVWPTPIT